MKKREKIIILITILAIIYGALDYFILSAGKNESIEPETANQSSKNLEAINQNLTRLKTIEQKKINPDYLISMIESGWKNDPFSKIEKFSKRVRNLSSDPEMINFKYSGFIMLGNKILAVIDGIEYTTGEYIKNSEYKIVQITPKTVFIKNNTHKQIVLYLKEG
jgi:hypothetical protein